MATVRSESSRRLRVWAVGAAAVLTAFSLRRALQSTHTSAGAATRLFSLGGKYVRLAESPHGGEWLLSVSNKGGDLTGFRQLLAGLAWAPWSRRVVRPLSQPGSYLLTGSGLRRVWSVPADGWQDDRHLFGLKDADTQLGSAAALDLRTGRLRFLALDFDPEIPSFSQLLPHPKASLHRISFSSEEDALSEVGDMEENTPDTPELEIPGADGWPGGGDQARSWGRIGSRKVILGTEKPDGEIRPGLYGLTTDDAPRSLYLTPEGAPLAISRDGRTLFFRREHALWRLDLRKPLPQLLDEVKVPALPDPPP